MLKNRQAVMLKIRFWIESLFTWQLDVELLTK